VKNETFNTLKNQGYHFEHNYGLGVKNLSTNFILLMMLAFLVDQTQQLSCTLFQSVWKKLGSKRALWEQMRGMFQILSWNPWKCSIWPCCMAMKSSYLSSV